MGSMPSPEAMSQRIESEDEARPMRFHVTFRVFEGVHRIDDVARMQRTVIAVMERCVASPRVLTHGMFADRRGGFVLVDFSDPTQLLELFAGLQDVATLEVHPVTRTEDALRFLRGMLASEALG